MLENQQSENASPTSAGLPLISFVLPVFNEREVLPAFHARLSEALVPLQGRYRFELIAVDDGSSDGSTQWLQQLAENDDRLVVLALSRNFGQQAAITAGLDHAGGEAVVIMDSDLQDPPEIAVELIRAWEAGNVEVVYATRLTRRENYLKRLTANAFYRLFSALSEIPVPRNTGDFRLLDRRVVQAIGCMREKNRYMRGLSAYAGFRQTAVVFDRPNRAAGTTKYSMTRMLRLAFDAIFSFSTAPLKAIIWLGLGTFMISALGIAYAIFMKFVFPEITVSGWTLMIIAILFIGGVQMLSIGVLGAYIGKIYTEVQDRPIYIVADAASTRVRQAEPKTARGMNDEST